MGQKLITYTLWFIKVRLKLYRIAQYYDRFNNKNSSPQITIYA